jgi:hypothetical protein
MTGGPGRRRGAANVGASVVVGLVAGTVVAGILVAGTVVAAGWLGLRSGPAPAWTATTSLAIMPADDIDRWAAASAAEALSTGQVAATAAEILRSPRVVADAARQQGLVDGAGVAVTVTVVPGTAVLRVAVSAPARAVAEATAEALPRAGAAYLRTISWPYRLVPVASAGAAVVAERPRRGLPIVLTIVLTIAALAALAAQQAWYRLRTAGRRRRTPETLVKEARE